MALLKLEIILDTNRLKIENTCYDHFVTELS
jgi:hypothetical protein